MAIALLALLFLGFAMLLMSIAMAEIPMVALILQNMFQASFISVHFTFGVLSALVCLFSVVITMFYFIGTGKAVKEGVRDHDLDSRYYDMILKYKRKYFPTMTLSLLVYIALPTTGAAAHARYLDPGLHGLVAFLTLATHGFICYQGWQYIFENDRVVATVNRLIQEKSSATGAGRSS